MSPAPAATENCQPQLVTARRFAELHLDCFRRMLSSTESSAANALEQKKALMDQMARAAKQARLLMLMRPCMRLDQKINI